MELFIRMLDSSTSYEWTLGSGRVCGTVPTTPGGLAIMLLVLVATGSGVILALAMGVSMDGRVFGISASLALLARNSFVAKRPRRCSTTSGTSGAGEGVMVGV